MEQLLTQHQLLRGLDADGVALVVGCAKNVVFEPGEFLLREGAPADTFYLVRRGHVAIEIHSPGRRPVVIETRGPESVVGWSWLVPPYRWTFDARVVDGVSAIAIDGACLRSKAASDPSFGFALLTRVSTALLSQLQATRLRLIDLYGVDHGI
jgi:CRP-like cAMP-binding protein